MQNASQSLSQLPPVRWASRHPRVAAWIVLSVGMVTLLILEARDVGLTLPQWVALIVATVLVAGACIWIISWEENDEENEASDATLDDAPRDDKPASG